MINYIELAQAHIANLYPTVIYRKEGKDIALQDLPPGTILGTWAYSIPHVSRIMLDKSKELAPGTLPTDVTRAWIKDAFNLPIRLRRAQIEGKRLPLPLYAKPGQYSDCVYLDVKGAYLSILRLGYDVEYLRGHHLGASFVPVPQVIAENKFCYSVAVAMSSAKQTNISMMGREGVFTHKGFNAYSNPCLYNLASDTLASVASEALRLIGDHIYYINTDGFIVERAFSQVLLDIIQSWGLEAREKASGQTTVFGVGQWICGDKRTKRFGNSDGAFRSIMPDRDESLWLKKRLTKLIQYAIIP